MSAASRMGRTRSYIVKSSCRQTRPSASSPAEKTRPPRSTMRIAKATAGTATRIRAARSDRGAPRGSRAGRGRAAVPPASILSAPRTGACAR
jgi:hypothetical protein